MATIGRRQPAFGMDSASVMSSNRRDRLLQHKRGTGRQTTRRQFGLTGKRSGITMPSHVVKDGQGFEDMDEFWNAAGSQPTSESPSGPSALSSSSSASYDAGAPVRAAMGGGRRFARRQPATVPENDDESGSDDDSASQSEDDVTDRRRRGAGGRRGRGEGRNNTATRRHRKEATTEGPESDGDDSGDNSDASQDQSDASPPARGRSAKASSTSRPARRMQFSSKFRKPKRGAAKSAPAKQSADTTTSGTNAVTSSSEVRRRSVAVGVSPGLALRSGGIGTHDTPHARRDSGSGSGIDFGTIPDTGGGDYDDGGAGYDDGGAGYDGDDHFDDEPAAAASSSSSSSSSSSAAATSKSGRVTKRKVKPKKKTQAAAAAAASSHHDWDSDDAGAGASSGEDDAGAAAGVTPASKRQQKKLKQQQRLNPILSPGGTDVRRLRKSIHRSQEEVQEALALGIRRSGRRRWAPLEYWKSEHVQYRLGDDVEGGGVISGDARAIKEGVLTPDTVKTKRAVKRSRGQTSKSSKGKAASSKRGKASAAAASGTGTDDDEDGDDGQVRYPAALNTRDLPSAVHLTREGQENLQVGQREGHPAYNIVCVRRAIGLKYQRLPSDPDTVTDDAATAVGMRSEASAAAAFDTPTFITGSVSVPPLCQKDEESTQHCLQIFCVVACQPKSLHVSVADKQFVLSPGDHFFVPHNTIYRLRNYSSTTGATIAFTVLKPTADEMEEESGDE